MKLLVCIAIPLLSVSCSGLNYAVETYGKVKPVRHEVPGREDRYRVFDKPQEQKMMITPSLSRSAGLGFVSGLTLGAFPTRLPEVEIREVAESYLDHTGRGNMSVVRAWEIIDPQWEAIYASDSATLRELQRLSSP